MAIADHDYHISIKDGDPITLWRYLSVDKFETMLKDSSLFFCRADHFPDKHEGSMPLREIEHRLEESKYLNSVYQQSRLTDEEILQKDKNMQQAHINQKRCMLISCWHMNDYENNAMWKSYEADSKCVAIKSTVPALISTIDEVPERIGISKVRYIDYSKDIFYDPIDFPHRYYNLLAPFFHKRKGIYTFENEFRLYMCENDAFHNELYWDSQPKSVGRDVTVDLTKFVHSIIISPFAKPSLKDEVKELVDRYGYKFQIKDSEVNLEPNF